MDNAKVTEHTAKDGTTYYTNGGCGRFRSKEVAQQAAANRERIKGEIAKVGFGTFFGIKAED